MAKKGILIGLVLVALLVIALAISRSRGMLNVEPHAAGEIEKAKRR